MLDGTVLEHLWEYASAPPFRVLVDMAARRSSIQAQIGEDDVTRQTQGIRTLLVGGALAMAALMTVQLGMLVP